jgi:peptidase E
VSTTHPLVASFSAVIYGGGEVAVNPESEVFIDMMLALAGERHPGETPSVVVISTARAEQATFDKVAGWAERSFGGREVDWCMLHEFGEAPSPHGILRMINEATAIYIPGGDTETMLAKWNEWGLTQLILKLSSELTFGGISAGLIWPFSWCHTDSDSYKPGVTSFRYRMISGLGVLPGAVCDAASFTKNPTYTGSRRDDFVTQLEATPGLNGVAVNNHTALRIEDGYATVLGNGKGTTLVTLHLWSGDKLVTIELGEGGTFPLEALQG